MATDPTVTPSRRHASHRGGVFVSSPTTLQMPPMTPYAFYLLYAKAKQDRRSDRRPDLPSQAEARRTYRRTYRRNWMRETRLRQKRLAAARNNVTTPVTTQITAQTPAAKQLAEAVTIVTPPRGTDV